MDYRMMNVSKARLAKRALAPGASTDEIRAKYEEMGGWVLETPKPKKAKKEEKKEKKSKK